MIDIVCLTIGSATKTLSNVLKGRNKHPWEQTLKSTDESKTRRVSLAVYHRDEDTKAETVSKKVYMIIDGEKVYIDPEIVKRYNLESQELSFFTGRKLYVEED